MPGEPEIFESFCLLQPRAAAGISKFINQGSLLQVLKKKKCPGTTEDLTVPICRDNEYGRINVRVIEQWVGNKVSCRAQN